MIFLDVANGVGEIAMRNLIKFLEFSSFQVKMLNTDTQTPEKLNHQVSIDL